MSFGYEPRELRRLLEDGHFDVIHAWEEPYTFAGYQIARAAERSAARFCFRTAQSLPKRYPPPFAHFERRVLQRADAWLSSARLVHDLMLQRGYPEDRGRMIRLAVDLEAFRPLDPAVRAAGRDELRLRAPVVGFTGRLVAVKGLDVLICGRWSCCSRISRGACSCWAAARTARRSPSGQSVAGREIVCR